VLRHWTPSLWWKSIENNSAIDQHKADPMTEMVQQCPLVTEGASGSCARARSVKIASFKGAEARGALNFV